jgi:hypothetical protein
MNETITEQRLTTLETLTTQNSQNISRIVDAIYGNGKPGILTNIELMKADLATQRSERRSSIGNWQWIVTTIIAILALIVTYLK